MTVVKTVIGSGILAIPFTIAKMGYVFGIAIFLVAGALSQYGSILLIKAKNLSRHSNYSTIFYVIW
jgi:amino acid permease